MEPSQKQADKCAARLKRLIARRVRESRSKSRFHRVNGMLMKKPAGARRGFERMFVDLEISIKRLSVAMADEQTARQADARQGGALWKINPR